MEKLKVLKLPEKPTIKDSLETLLKEASHEVLARKVKEIAIVYVDDNDLVGRLNIPVKNYHVLIGALETSKAMILRQWFAESEVEQEYV